MKDYKLKNLKEKMTEIEKKKSDEINEGWFGENGIMNYDPYNIKKEGE